MPASPGTCPDRGSIPRPEKRSGEVHRGRLRRTCEPPRPAKSTVVADAAQVRPAERQPLVRLPRRAQKQGRGCDDGGEELGPAYPGYPTSHARTSSPTTDPVIVLPPLPVEGGIT
jgi:hypothetical protein